ncbi:MAG: hypothetical protein ACRD2X_01015 [Vicinamibacteraceae bacterium]
MRGILIAITLLVTGASTVAAQVAVFDPAVTFRNRVTAVVKELLIALQREQHGELRRMARRLRASSLRQYALDDAPKWRIHAFEDGGVFRFAGPYHAALNYGDPNGAGYLAVSHPVLTAQEILARLSPGAQRALTARLATLDVADAAAVDATHDTGRVRFNGRRELAAIDALQADIVDPSDEQSAAAVLDKISGAVLIGARQRQARTQLLVGILEQLLVDSKRVRDTDAAAMNMQLVTWRDRRAASEAFVAGSTDALETWRQP